MVFLKMLFVLTVTFVIALPGANGIGGAWSSAHATFYGGSDASGTMGKNAISPNPVIRVINSLKN